MILIIFVLLLLTALIMFLLIKHLKKASNSSPLPNTSTNPLPKYADNIDENYNPIFEVELINSSKYKSAIYRSYINETVYFKTNNDKRINVYTINKRLIGQIAIKDYKKFSLISTNPELFEGHIKSFPIYNYTSKKVIIAIQVKPEHSKKVYSMDKSNLNNLITLKEIFKENEIIETNYGTATIIEVKDNYLVVEVPSLGKREIYDIESLIK